jgi:hypothetical protein
MTSSRAARLAGTLALLAASTAVADPGFTWRKEPNGAFRVGESILYVVKYGFIPAGHATLEVTHEEPVDGRPAYYILSRARTNKAMDIVFKVRDKNESWMDKESLCSVGFGQRIREGLYRRENRTRYDHASARFTYVRRRKGKEHTLDGGMPAFVQDVLSSLYFIRTRDLEVGRDYSLDANSAGKTWPLVVHVKRLVRIKVPAGRFECYHIEPILAGEGIFQQQGRLEVWLTKDARKVPVLLRSRVLVGAFDAEMTHYEPGESRPAFMDGKGFEEVDKETEVDLPVPSDPSAPPPKP